MAPLPEARLSTSLRCFAHGGVDFAALATLFLS